MATRLSNLFDERLKRPGDLVASEAQSLETISTKVEEQELVLQKLKSLEVVRPKVDYSNFSNFVFFNSALDYFNITGEKILNEYPYDGDQGQIEQFVNDLDDYQQYVFNSAWPRQQGHLRFNPASAFSYVEVNDVGIDNGVQKTALLNPGTGSVSIEMWCVPPPALTGTDDVMVAFQKASGSENYSGYFSGSSFLFSVASGSTSATVSSSINSGQISYFACVYDKTNTKISLLSGSATKFPVVVMSSSVTLSQFTMGSTKFVMGSGTIASKVTRPLSGALDNVRVWKTALALADVTSSYNAKVYAQKYLVGLWRFNETIATSSIYPITGDSCIAYDYSGRRLNGTIKNHFYGLRSSGSLVPYESSDLNLQVFSPAVQSYVSIQQASGSAYDRDNDNIIKNLLPEQFFRLEEFANTTVLQDFLYVFARQFDQIKVGVDQFLNVLRTNYTSYNQTPDALLEEVGRFFGWDFVGNFINSDAIQYLFGKNVLANVEANKELDVKLHQIKREFWRRTLNNLAYLYKTKGTRESVESLLRIYGVNRNFVRLKEYGYKRDAGLATNRIYSEKSTYALVFGSGSNPEQSVSNVYGTFESPVYTTEFQVRFPTATSSKMSPWRFSGSLWSLFESGSADNIYQLYYTKEALTDQTGTLILSSSNGQLVLSDIPIFDGRWYHVAFVRNQPSGSEQLNVHAAEDGEIIRTYSASWTPGVFRDSWLNTAWVGYADYVTGSNMWAQEFRLWNQPLSETELIDHTLNFQSYGTEEVNGEPDRVLHWRLNDNVDPPSAGWSGPYQDIANEISASQFNAGGTGYDGGENPFHEFYREYNFIAPPDYGWNEDRVRIFDKSQVSYEEAFVENNDVALEFNMVDALNEDISQILATMDDFNNFIGLPANRYRSSYDSLDILRHNYFKHLSGKLNFRVFADMLEFFDRTFIDMVRKLIPANSNFLGDEFVVENHMLERPKVQWNYRRADVEFQPLGVITVYSRS